MTTLLIAGAAAGYALLVGTNPVRVSLLDGLRALHRYPRLWLLLGLFGCGYAAFDLAVRLYFSVALPPGEGPLFLWARSAYHPGADWWHGTRESLWYLPPRASAQIALTALASTLDGLGGLFNSAVSTFPVSAIAAAMLLMNWNGHRTMLHKGLARRWKARGWLLHGLILLTAVAALAKPVLYLLPRFLSDATAWYQWAPVFAWLAFFFEYHLSVGVQVYVLLLSYCWLRGLSFRPAQLVDFTIRRFASVVRWALVLFLLSSVLIDLPLILKNFAPFLQWLEADAAMLDRRNAIGRAILNVVVLLFATVQIILTFHNGKLRRTLRDHWHFVREHPGALGWFMLLAALHLYGLHFVNGLCQRGLGEGTSLWVLWSLLFPWLAAYVTAWLLGAWVSTFHRAATGRLADKQWVRF